MPSKKINKEFNDSMYYLTLTVWRWYYIFDRHNRWGILADSLRYCIENKGLDLIAFVFMLNHIHLIVSSRDVIGFVRDFKRYTTREIKNNIKKTELHILKLFMDKKGEYHFWQKTNMPLFIETDYFFKQKNGLHTSKSSHEELC